MPQRPSWRNTALRPSVSGVIDMSLRRSLEYDPRRPRGNAFASLHELALLRIWWSGVRVLKTWKCLIGFPSIVKTPARQS